MYKQTLTALMVVTLATGVVACSSTEERGPVERAAANTGRVVDDSVISFEVAAEGFIPLPVGTRCEMRLTHIFEMRDGKIAKEIGIEGPPRAL